MKKSFIICFILLLFSGLEVSAQEKPEIIFLTDKAVRENIYIDYLIKGKGNKKFNIAIYLRQYNDEHFTFEPKHIYGDIGEVYGEGTKRITWDFKYELPEGYCFQNYYFYIVDKSRENVNTGIRTKAPVSGDISQVKMIPPKYYPEIPENEKENPVFVKKSGNTIYWVGGAVLLAGAGGVIYYLLTREDKLTVVIPGRPALR